MNSQYNIIIVAGGTGSRMQSTVPKQFIEVKGRCAAILAILESTYEDLVEGAKDGE